MIPRERNAEIAAEQILASVDHEWLRETLEGAAFVPPHRLSELLQTVLVKEFDIPESNAEGIVERAEAILIVLRRRLLT